MKEIDWANLSFGYMKTDYNVRCYYRDGAWGESGTLFGRNVEYSHGRHFVCTMGKKRLKG